MDNNLNVFGLVSQQNECLVVPSVLTMGKNKNDVMEIIVDTLRNNTSIFFAKDNLKFNPEDKPGEIFIKVGRINRIFRSYHTMKNNDDRKEQKLAMESITKKHTQEYPDISNYEVTELLAHHNKIIGDMVTATL